MLPLILLVGNAGSGKDTVGEIIAEYMGGTTVAFADRLKYTAKKIFMFNNEQLWGASEKRNEVDNRKGLWDCLAMYTEPHAFTDDIFSPFQDPRASFFHLKEILLDLNSKNKTEISPRKVLQLLGTEWGRAVEKDVWVDYTKNMCLRLLGGKCKYDRKTASITQSEEDTCPFVVVTDGRFLNEIMAFKSLGAEVWYIKNAYQPTEPVGVQGHTSESELNTAPSYLFDKVIVNDKTKGREYLTKEIRRVLDYTYSIGMFNDCPF